MVENKEAKNQEEGSESLTIVNPESQQGKSQDGKNCQWLNNLAGKRQLEVKYEDEDTLLPGNKHLWASIVRINGAIYGEGQGSTKVEARGKAAKKALAALKDQLGVNINEHYD